jgi:hypothetical protein
MRLSAEYVCTVQKMKDKMSQKKPREEICYALYFVVLMLNVGPENKGHSEIRLIGRRLVTLSLFCRIDVECGTREQRTFRNTTNTVGRRIPAVPPYALRENCFRARGWLVGDSFLICTAVV